ncbi:MAG: protein kinase [Lentisphaeria bacterium]|nr:protein kinase [Lentisphaeria bacterium]
MVDHLRLISDKGRGPLGHVYLVHDTMGGRMLAAKVLPRELTGHEPEATRLRKSLVAAAHVSHPRLVPLRHLHEVWEADPAARALGFDQGTLIVLSDYVNAADLRHWLRDFAPDPEHIAAAFRQVAEGLDAAHAAGVYHAVLGPGNVLVTADGDAFVADLGAAAELRTSLENLGSALGRESLEAPWIAPEIRAGTPPRQEADVFSLAALISASLSGKWDCPALDFLPLDRLTLAQNRALRGALAENPAERPDGCAALVEEVFNGAARGHAHAPARPGGGREESARDVGQAPPAVAPPSPTPAPVPPPAPVPATAPGPAPAAARGAPPAPSAPRPEVTGAPGDGARERPPVAAAAPVVRGLSRAVGNGHAAWVNVAIGIAAAAVVVLILFLLWQRARRAGGALPSAPAWGSRHEETGLARRFVYSAILAEPDTDLEIRARLLGQTRRLDLGIENGRAFVREHRGPGAPDTLRHAELPMPLASGDSLSVVKTPDTIGLYVGGVRTLSIAWPVESLVQACWQVPEGRPTPAKYRMQKVGALVFADEFMHAEGELGEWRPESGTWRVHALQNPIRSANAFSFSGQGEDALATAGQWFWRDYQMSVSVLPLPGSAFGVKMNWTGNENTYEILWRPGKGGNAGFLSVDRVAHRARSTLGHAPVAITPEQWYRLEVSQAHGLLTVSIDGVTVLDVQDPAPLLGGRIGLWTRGGEGTLFDDVAVTPVEQVSFDFARQSTRGVDLLRPVGGQAGGRVLQAGIDVGGVLLENAAVKSVVLGLAGCGADAGPVALVARHGNGEELALELRPTAATWEARIVARRAGEESVLATGPMTVPGEQTALSFHVLGSEAWGVVEGSMVVHAADVPVRGQGICGVRIPPAAGVSQRSLEVSPERPLPPIENRVETFTHEASMQNWTSPVLEWNVEYAKDMPVYWHQSDFWQDLAALMSVDTLANPENPQVVGLALRNPEAAPDSDLARQLSVVHDPNRREIRLLGLPGEEKTFRLMRQKVSELSLERRRGRLLARLNGALLWNEPLPDSMRGLCQIGRYGRGNTVAWAEAVRIRAAGVGTSGFREAPTAWVPAAGTWEVTNRWQCDPRWSFYSGAQRGGVACNWSKLRHGGNVTIEFFAGPKMDQDRGRRYEYAGDINAVIGADGKDITSGYSFLFGGWNDRGSQIVRGKEIVGENRRIFVPREASTHRRWFYIKLRKSGNRLSYWVDGSLVATVADDHPLDGDRFGLWTWDNGIMVAQFRVSTDSDLMPAPLMESKPAVPRTPYDR